MAFDNVLIHTCTIYKKNISFDVKDENGHPYTYETNVSYRCRFFKKEKFRQSGIVMSSDVGHFVVPLSIMLPANVDLKNSDGEIDPTLYRLVTTTDGYSGSYTLEDINPIYGRSIIHHYVADVVKV